MVVRIDPTGKTDTIKRTAPFPLAPDALPDPPKRIRDMQQEPHATTARYILRDRFGHIPNVLVAAEGYLCANARDQEGWVVPDLLVAFDVPARLIWDRNGYAIDEVGKPPDFVLEVASRTTGRRDTRVKRAIYQGMGVGEQWEFDASGGRYHGSPLSGFVRVGRVYLPIELIREPNGMIWGHSRALGLDICWVNGRLRFRDPLTGKFLQEYEEVTEERDTAEAERDIEMEARLRAEVERERERARANTAEAEIERLKRLLDG